VNPIPTPRPGPSPRSGPNDRAAAPDAVARRAAGRLRAERREGGLAIALRFLSYGSLLLLWVLGSRQLGEVLPGPLETFAFIGREIDNGRLGMHLWITTQRVLIAFLVAITAGVALGALMGRSKRVDDLLQGWLIVALTVPRILLFVVAYLLAGSERSGPHRGARHHGHAHHRRHDPRGDARHRRWAPRDGAGVPTLRVQPSGGG
jgi:hypothetical protein